MFNHVSIGVHDIGKAQEFYDAVLKPLGYRCLSSSPGALGYGKDAVAFWVLRVNAPVPPNMESGLHFCFDVPERTSVDAFHKAALNAGGRDNGRPGLREDYGPDYYAAFVIDPDGYRIEAYCAKQA